MQTRGRSILMLLVAACATPAPTPVDTAPVDPPPIEADPTRGTTGDQAWDRAVLDQIERDARKLANADGCEDAGDCRVVAIGAKACGGPRDYIAYCAATADTMALFRKLAELARAERAFNERYGIMSTCEFLEAPSTALVGRSCRAVR